MKKSNKPLVADYHNESGISKKIAELIPLSLKNELVKKERGIYTGEWISCMFEPYNSIIDVPRIRDEKTKEYRSYRVPTNYTIDQITDYIYKELKVKDYIVSNEKNVKGATDFLALALKVETSGANPNARKYIILDNKVAVGAAFNYLYLLEHPNELKPNN